MDIGIPTATAKDVLAVHQVESGKPAEVRPTVPSSPTMFTDALIALLDSVKSPAAPVASLRTSAATKGGSTQAPRPAAKKEAGRPKDEQGTDSKRNTEKRNGFVKNESALIPPTFVVVEPVKTQASPVVVPCEAQPPSDAVASGVETAGLSNNTSTTTRPAGKVLEASATVSVPDASEGISKVDLSSQTEQIAPKVLFAGSGQVVATGKDVPPRTGTISPGPGLPQSQTATLPDSARHLANSFPVPQFTKEEARPNAGEAATQNVRAVALKKNAIAASAPPERSMPHEARVLSFHTEAVSAVVPDSFSASSNLRAEAYPNSVDGKQEINRRVEEAPSQDARNEASAASMALFSGVLPVASSDGNALNVQPPVKTDRPRAVSATPTKASRDELRGETFAPRGMAAKAPPQRSQDDKTPDSATAKHSGSGTPNASGKPEAAVHAPNDSAPAKDSIEPNSLSSAPRTTPQDPGGAPMHAPIQGTETVGHSSAGPHVSTVPSSRGEQVSGNSAPHASDHVESRPSPLLVQNARLVQQPAHSEIKVELRTPEAGKVEVHTVTRDGRTEAVIAAELGDTRQALMNALPEMQQRFHDNNVHIQFQSSIGATMEGHDGGQRQGQRNEASPQPQQQDSPLEPASLPTIPEISVDSSSRSTLKKLSVHA